MQNTSRPPPGQAASPCEALHQESTARIESAIAGSIDLFIEQTLHTTAR